jgi:hypothetical protein
VFSETHFQVLQTKGTKKILASELKWDKRKNPVICKHPTVLIENRSSSVGIATDYGLDGPGSIPSKGQIFSSQHPNKLWDSPSLFSTG